MPKLDRAFYDRATETVARELLGMVLVRVDDGVERAGRIVEVEAYIGAHDKASHSSRGLTDRTRTMYGPPGHAYVYVIYGIHNCLNVVTEPQGNGCAVLLRALEPVRNVDLRTSGPGLLCRAMGIDRSLDGKDLLSHDLYITSDPALAKRPRIVKRPRIGVDYAGRWARRLLRFYIAGNRHVSRP